MRPTNNMFEIGPKLILRLYAAVFEFLRTALAFSCVLTWGWRDEYLVTVTFLFLFLFLVVEHIKCPTAHVKVQFLANVNFNLLCF